jgi:SOUL heme-binding protein
MNPMAPAIIQVNSTDPDNVIKTMFWPIQYALPNAPQPPIIPTLPDDVPTDVVSFVTIPESVVAIHTFSDMIVEPLVRKVDRTLRQYLQRDGLFSPENDDEGEATMTKLLTFAQHDAIYSMGERRCEVHVTLPHGTHPWC